MPLIDECEIEKTALALRARLGASETRRLSIYDIVANDLKKIDTQLKVEICNEEEIGINTEAEADTENKILRIRSDVWQDLKQDNPRARFTVAHEIGHFCLQHDGLRRRNVSNPYPTPKRRRQEYEANRFAAYFLAPTDLALRCQSVEDISRTFGVSRETASRRYEELDRVRRAANNEKRKLPATVIDFMKAREKATGYRFKSMPDEDRKDD